MSTEKDLVFKPTALMELPTLEILPNPNNPRLFFPENTMQILRDSIKTVGILVPLVAYKSKSDGKYYLLDGERRWKCAKDIGLEKVPVNIIPEPSTLQNIITMFNIHKLREDWELMPTALKLEALTRLLKERMGRKRIGVTYLSQITRLSKPTVQRCFILISYDKNYQDLMLAPDEQRIKTDFFIELYPVLNLIEKYFPDIAEKYTRNGVIDSFLYKYRKGIITDVVDFRKVRSLIRSIEKGVPKEKVKERLEALIGESSITIQESYAKEAKFVDQLEDIKVTLESLMYKIRDFSPEGHGERLKFREFLQNVINELQKKLSEQQVD